MEIDHDKIIGEVINGYMKIKTLECQLCFITKDVKHFNSLECVKSCAHYGLLECDECCSRLEAIKLSKFLWFNVNKNIAIIKERNIHFPDNLIVFNLSTRNIKDIWIKQKGKCYLTGEKMTYGNVSDNESFYDTGMFVQLIDQSRGFVKDNIYLICIRNKKYNNRK